MNAESNKLAVRKHYYQNKDAVLAKMREDYYQNRYGMTVEEYREMRRERSDQSKISQQVRRDRWRINHPEHQQKIERKSEERRRARKLDQFIEDIDRDTVYQMHGGMCGICEGFIIGKFHVDHVIPLSKGGLHGYVNVQPAHPKCNEEKAATV